MQANKSVGRRRQSDGGTIEGYGSAAAVQDALRREIVAGKPPPGGQLPTHAELARRFGVSNVTIQRAMAQLEAEGFVRGRPRAGTLVVESPPHLSHYGLVFWNDPAAPASYRTWSMYHQALTQAALKLERQTGRRILQFHGIDSHTDVPDRRRLIDRLVTHRLAGVVFAHGPQFLEGTPILDEPGIPRLELGTGAVQPVVRSVRFGGWLEKALDYLAAIGRSKVALIENLTTPIPEPTALREALAARNMTTCSRWRQIASMQAPEGARYAAELLMHDREPPDALLVRDDNYVEPALAGLIAAGVRVPDDVAVVAAANWPAPPVRTLPVRLLGFDLVSVLRTCMFLIDAWRLGNEPPAVTPVPALWEEEVAAQPVLAMEAV